MLPAAASKATARSSFIMLQSLADNVHPKETMVLGDLHQHNYSWIELGENGRCDFSAEAGSEKLMTKLRNK